MDSKKILTDLIELQKKYSTTYRAITTEERYHNLVDSGLIKQYSYDSEFIREPLIEHVGHLPIIASYLYPNLENKDKIDLGRSLIMLSIHDFGETEVGDQITYQKSEQAVMNELEVVKKRLPEVLFSFFEEFEKQETMDAKFAKAVDTLAPELHELALPLVTKERFKHFGFNTDKIIQKKEGYFSWDKTLKNLFQSVIKEYRTTIDDAN